MKIIEDKNRLFELFSELSSGGMDSYDQDDQALILQLDSDGGPYEDATLYLKFCFTEYFQLPLSLDAICGYGIDEIRTIDAQECESFIDKGIVSHFDFSCDYKCYRFYANGKASPYYIYCSNLIGWLKPDGWCLPEVSE